MSIISAVIPNAVSLTIDVSAHGIQTAFITSKSVSTPMPAFARVTPVAFAVPDAVASAFHAVIIQLESRRRSVRTDQGVLTAPIDGLVKTNRQVGQNEEVQRVYRDKTTRRRRRSASCTKST